MAELKTHKIESNPNDFIKAIADSEKQRDAIELLKIFEKVNGQKGKMWGTSIIGFGDQVLTYESGRTLDWFVMGFSPRKQNFALYVPGAIEDKSKLLDLLGKYKIGKGCLYINKLSEIDMKILNKIFEYGLKHK